MELLLAAIVFVLFSIFNYRRYTSKLCSTAAGRSSLALEYCAAGSVYCAARGELLPTLICLCLVVIYILDLESILQEYNMLIDKVNEVLKNTGDHSNE